MACAAGLNHLIIEEFVNPNFTVAECYKRVKCSLPPTPPPKPNKPDEKKKSPWIGIGVTLILLGILLWVYISYGKKKRQ
jgi:hypothetical protein